MFQSGDASGISATSSRAVSPKTKTPKPAPVDEASQPVELIQLPSGRIVPADSDEGRASQGQVIQPPDITVTSPKQQRERRSEARGDDEVHRIWEEMGLSRRAWSKTPSPPPEGVHRLG
ncbi:hypothetical protein diail_8093 [Diaporthe ilicicola]|nr:hypothetical protein diail_8093 [Diaporthe ilicicola]